MHTIPREDVNEAAFHPPYLIGPHKLVILDPLTRILFFYQPGEEKTFCRIQVPVDTSYPADWLLDCPGLGTRALPETIRDFRAVLWLLIHGRAAEVAAFV
jgi:hypothetical protein